MISVFLLRCSELKFLMRSCRTLRSSGDGQHFFFFYLHIYLEICHVPKFLRFIHQLCPKIEMKTVFLKHIFFFYIFQ